MSTAIGRDLGSAVVLPAHGSTASRLLDAVRGIAALLVVAGHCRQLVARAGDLAPDGSSFIEKLLLVPAGCAQESVAVFFVLSGYLVGGQVVRQCRDDRFAWGEYVAKRLSRLWTVLVPGLLVTWAVVAAAGPLMPPALMSLWGGGNHSIGTAACNAAFLQESRCPRYGVNESLWSLSYEFWFYILFAAVCAGAMAVRHRRRGAVVLNAAIVAGALALFGPHLLILMPAWLLGVVVATIPAAWPEVSARRKVVALLAAAMCVSLAMMATSVLGLGRTALTAFVAVPATALVLVCSRIQTLPVWLAAAIGPPAKLGRVSFSTYVFHAPFVAVGAVLLSRSGWTDRLGLVAAAYLLMLLVLPITWLGWWLTERHTPAIRNLALRATSDRTADVVPSVPALEPILETERAPTEDAAWQIWEQIMRGWKTDVRY